KSEFDIDHRFPPTHLPPSDKPSSARGRAEDNPRPCRTRCSLHAPFPTRAQTRTDPSVATAEPARGAFPAAVDALLFSSMNLRLARAKEIVTAQDHRWLIAARAAPKSAVLSSRMT